MSYESPSPDCAWPNWTNYCDWE